MEFWVMLQSHHGSLKKKKKKLWDGTPPPRCGQTNKVKLLPSRRTTYAGGNNLSEPEGRG